MADDSNDCDATTMANGSPEETDPLEELKQRKWVTGKDAVADIKANKLSRGKNATVSNKRGSTFKRIQCSSGKKMYLIQQPIGHKTQKYTRPLCHVPIP
ncbi:hypothetical protein PC121_g21154 [Phytophthora cactorum]|nr:hypothetical protein PC120_g20051 [Phytophthora cactorum]KAG3045620.1 hypothetical protein PC121_g21154 [Phytophthora cactorum]